MEGVDPAVEAEDPNAAILPARAWKAEVEKDAAPRKISKGEQRKLKQIAKEKALKAQREQVTSLPQANHGHLPDLIVHFIAPIDWVDCGQ